MIMLPSDPGMLYSLVNMKLRDEYSDLDDLCGSMGIDKEELEQKMRAAGFEYDVPTNQFR